MVFNDFSSEYEKCDLPFNIDCSARPKLRKYTNGYHDQFPVDDKRFTFAVAFLFIVRS